MITAEALATNFFISFYENMGNGESYIEELCCDLLKDFNLVLNASLEKGMPFREDVQAF